MSKQFLVVTSDDHYVLATCDNKADADFILKTYEGVDRLFQRYEPNSYAVVEKDD